MGSELGREDYSRSATLEIRSVNVGKCRNTEIQVPQRGTGRALSRDRAACARRSRRHARGRSRGAGRGGTCCGSRSSLGSGACLASRRCPRIRRRLLPAQAKQARSKATGPATCSLGASARRPSSGGPAGCSPTRIWSVVRLYRLHVPSPFSWNERQPGVAPQTGAQSAAMAAAMLPMAGTSGRGPLEPQTAPVGATGSCGHEVGAIVADALVEVSLDVALVVVVSVNSVTSPQTKQARSYCTARVRL